MLRKYNTGLVTLVQFIFLGVLNLVYALFTGVDSCVKHEDCFNNAFLAIVVFVLLGIWFAFIAALGYAVQERRNKKMALALIGLEGITALFALFNLKHHIDAFSMVISASDLVLALLVMYLAYRVFRSGGGRIRATSNRPRQRKRPTSEDL